MYSIDSSSLAATAALGFRADITTTLIPQTSVTPQVHLRLTSAQRTKLLWHNRCNDVAFPTLNEWIRHKLLPVDPSIASCPNPVCLACKLGKSHCKSHCKATGAITEAFKFPGAGVNADQLESGCPGRIPTVKGLPSLKRYRYCNIWVDNCTRYIFPTFYESKHASEFVKSKLEFQHFAAKHNVKIHKIRADNGVYASNAFQFACDQDQQDLSFCAVGGH